MVAMLQQHQKELDLMQLSIEMEDLQMELREKQERMDMLTAQKASLSDPADPGSAESSLQAAGGSHSLSTPRSVQTLPAKVVVSPGRNEVSPEVPSPRMHLDMVELKPLTSRSEVSPTLPTVSSPLCGLQPMGTPELEERIDGVSPSGRRGVPLQEVCNSSNPVLLMIMIMIIMKIWMVFHTLIFMRNVMKRKRKGI
jgi:hypothetical protein